VAALGAKLVCSRGAKDGYLTSKATTPPNAANGRQSKEATKTAFDDLDSRHARGVEKTRYYRTGIGENIPLLQRVMRKLGEEKKGRGGALRFGVPVAKRRYSTVEHPRIVSRMD
jgi:hypothetical protein